MAVITDKNRIDNLLNRRISADGFFPSREDIKNRLTDGTRLKFYYGIDPTGPDIHLGHTVQLWLLKELADLGHEIILLIGDFTARIGDPTGKDKTRKPLTEKEIEQNHKNYLKQVHRILPEGSFKVEHNSKWLKNMDLEKIIDLTSRVTVQQMIIRDMFQERINNSKPIAIHEFLYPLMQGYDSVAMEVDGEVGGHDQIFNMLVGRDLENSYLNKDKMVLATRLLVDESTGKKMSKSEGEIIAMSDEPAEIRRKILAVDDKIVKTIFELCTAEDQEWINSKTLELQPRESKELLSDKLIAIFHGENKVSEAHKPKEIKFSELKGLNLAGTLEISGVASSMSSAKSLINEGAVRVNGEVVTNWKESPKEGDKIQVGKGKFLEIK